MENPELFPPVPQELHRGMKDEILHNILFFITIMLVCKLFSSLWRFRSYRRSLRKYAIPKRPKVSIKGDSRSSLSDDMMDTIRKPKHAYRIRGIEELKSIATIGQHFAVRREYLRYPLYHHILVTSRDKDRVKILHYNGEAGVFLKSGSKVFGHVLEEETSLVDKEYFDQPDNLFLVQDPAYPKDTQSVQQLIVKAKERIGENRYGITYNNCEHFVRWALTGRPHCQQYETSNMSDKVLGAMVDELPNIGIRVTMKLCKEVLYGITMGVEQLVLQNSARLIQHTASTTVACTLSTGAATLGWSAPAEAAFLTFRILDWKFHKRRGTMSERDYNNAKDKAITGSVFSLALTTVGAMFGQLVIPMPVIGAVMGSFWGGFVGRLIGIVLAGYGIAVKEKFSYDSKHRRAKYWIYRRLNKSIDAFKERISNVRCTLSTLSSNRKYKHL